MVKEKKSGFFKPIVSSCRSSSAFMVCLFLIILAYRIQLTTGLLTSSVKPFDFNPRYRLFEVILSYLPYDLSLVLGCFLIAWLFSIVFGAFKKGWPLSILKGAGWVSLNLAILLTLIIHGAHIRLLFDAQTGLTISLIKEVWMNIPFIELVRFVTLKEALLLLLPIGLFWLVLLRCCR